MILPTCGDQKTPVSSNDLYFKLWMVSWQIIMFICEPHLKQFGDAFPY